MPRPLEGVRVCDFSHVMAGPFASHFLALLGAEVVKIEPPGRGDPMRYYGPDRAYDGMSPAFIAANVGKKSIVLDLKQASAKAAAERLITQSDVVLENFRPGVIDRLGLGYERCKALNPKIVFCSVSGYGQSGPLRDYPAIDNIVQATSGMMSLSGEPDSEPMRVGFPAVDTYTGTLAAMAILSALFGRERFGEGQYIDVAMLDASLVFMASAVVPYLVSGRTLPRTGNTGYSGQPTAGMFTCKDGVGVSLGVVQQNQFERLCEGLERPDLLTDPRFANPTLRKSNERELIAILSEVFATRDADAWEAKLSRMGVPCGAVRDIPAVAELPHLSEREVRAPLSIPGLPGGGEVRALNAGFLFGHDGPKVPGPPPRLGEHTAEVLEALGYGAAERDAMLETGAAVQG